MNLIKLIFLLFFLAYFFKSQVIVALKFDLDSKTLRVVDGDTLILNSIKYRLYGIDAPELNQICSIDGIDYKCGIKSKSFLITLINEKKVKCFKKSKDRYKRTIAVCKIGNLDINKSMVRNGWAIAYKRYSREYLDDEDYAKKNGLGLWEGKFIKPENWRRSKK